jgi:hypothetical protein
VWRSPLFAPFQVRSFRFQYPADLLTSWGTEMENLILSWYVLVETGSVLLLTLFGSLQYFGTLVAPGFGMAGDRLGHRNVLCAMRVGYAILAGALMAFAFTGTLRPLHVFVIAGIAGLVRPSDLAMRSALVAETMPIDRFVSAMGAARTTSDSARTVGALVGAGLFATLGMGPAYVAIACFYVAGFLLTLGVGAAQPGRGVIALSARPSLWRDLREGLAYLWDTPSSLAALWLAFLVNMTAYPLTSGLLPYVAMDIYHVDQTGLGYLIASFAFGGLLGSVGRRPCRSSGQAGAHDDRVRVGLVRDAAGVRAYREPTKWQYGSHSRRPRAKSQFGTHVGHVAARRRGVPRPGDGDAHAGHLWAAHRPDRGRRADRSDRLCADRDPVLRVGYCAHPNDSPALASRAMAAARTGECAVSDRIIADR